MHILVVTQYFWPENFRINDLVAGLVKRGHIVTVLTGKPNYPGGKIFAEYIDQPEKFMSYSQAKIIRVPMFARGHGGVRLFLNYISYVIGACIWGTWSLRKESFDVIFVYEPSPVTVGIPAIFLGRLKKIPVVFWVLDLWPETLSAIGVVRSPTLLKWIGKVVSFIYKHCALVLGQSRSFIKYINKYCSDSDKIRYFPNWAEDIFVKTVQDAAPEIPLNKDVFTILFAGNIGDAQDLPAILNAAEITKNDSKIRWIIVGDGRKSDWLCHEVYARGLSENVLLTGRFPVERMPSFYAHADALLVSLKKDPVFSQTIPGKVQSYLMSEIPLLGMLDGEGALVIEESGAGFTCAAGDSAGLAAAALKMSELSVKDRILMGKNGRDYAEKEFNREILMTRLEELFNEVVR